MPTSYKHSDKSRPNIPAAGMAVKDADIEKAKIPYLYDPHLSPVLRFDESGETDTLSERVETILEKAKSEPLTSEETQLLQDALLRSRQPWLEWSTKREKKQFEVDPVALHIHEKVSARAILKASERADIEEDLFSIQRLDREQERQFYQHDVDWANRLILGDSLQVMTSLSRREGLAGQVQMIYIDPPYGISFSSNWQNEVGNREVKDKNSDLTREPEMIKAYRDTWTLGVHSYLDYLKQRLITSLELLSDSGSVFVQISDENLHRVRALLDEVFGAENFVSCISVEKTSTSSGKTLSCVVDYLLWYAKKIDIVSYYPIFKEKVLGQPGTTQYVLSEDIDGFVSRIKSGNDEIEEKRVFAADNFTSMGPAAVPQPFEYNGRSFSPSANAHWKPTYPEGVQRIARAERLYPIGNSLMYKRKLGDFPVNPISNVWNDTKLTGFGEDKYYVVQTAASVIQRCILMTTRPGEIVLDPTCGSGTTAYAAEKYGRRWITIDSSRVAAAIARQRLLTAKFESYKTKDESEGVDLSSPKNPGTGFVYKTVPHITLKSIAQNKSLDSIFEKHEPILSEKLKTLNEALTLVDEGAKNSLIEKLLDKHKREGSNAVTDADHRRWMLPGCDTSSIKTFTANAASRVEGFSKNITANQVKKYKEFAVELESGSWEAWQVPFDTAPDWPEVLQDALTDYRTAWRAKMDEVNKCIEANAAQEELVDQPEVVRGVTRVSGPFTVESIRPLENSMKGKVEDSPIGGAPEELETFGDREVQEEADYTEADVTSINATSHIDRMLSLLRSDGLTFPGNKHVSFEGDLHPIDSEFLHAEASYVPSEGAEPRSVGIVIGPEHGAVTAFQASSAIFQAIGRKYDELVFAGFAFDSGAQDKIQEANENEASGITVHLCLIRPDVLTEGLKRNEKGKSKTAQASQQIFTVFGQPRTRLQDEEDGEVIVHMEGVDVYDPVKNELIDTKANKVAAWFLDTNYDGKTFCICQAFFPDKNAWVKLAKALKEDNSGDGSRFAEVLANMSGQSSLPFRPGKYKRVAVKVIDPRGNEVLRVHELNH